LQTYKVIVKKAKITRAEPIIALVRGTTTGNQMMKGKVRYFRNYNEIIHAMERGDIDYTVTDQPIAIHMLRSVTQAYSIVKVLPQSENYGIGIPKKSDELRKAVNRALRDIARSGRLAYAQRQWL
jgi:ABC-type amino acid transport substrate-binding protein